MFVVKIKSASSSAPVEGRIDGVAYGEFPSGNIGRWWPYPTMHQSAAFQYSNPTVIALSLQFQGLDNYIKTDWLDWVDELDARELCYLWGALIGARTDEERAQAGYVNCNQWRMNLSIPPSDVPPDVDLLPNGDSVTIVSATPLVLQWNRPAPVVPFTCYLALFAAVRNNAPVSAVPAQKLRWLGNYSTALNFPRGITLDPLSLVKGFNSCFVQYGVACGVPGSVPFMAVQTGAQY